MNRPQVKHSLFHADAHLASYQDERRKKLYRTVASELDRQAGPDTIEVIIGTIIEDAVLYFNPDKRPELKTVAKKGGLAEDAYFQRRLLHNVHVLSFIAMKLQNPETN